MAFDKGRQEMARNSIHSDAGAVVKLIEKKTWSAADIKS